MSAQPGQALSTLEHVSDRSPVQDLRPSLWLSFSGDFVMANLAWQHLTNSDDDDLWGQRWRLCIHPDDRDTLSLAIDEVVHDLDSTAKRLELRLGEKPSWSHPVCVTVEALNDAGAGAVRLGVDEMPAIQRPNKTMLPLSKPFERAQQRLAQGLGFELSSSAKLCREAIFNGMRLKTEIEGGGTQWLSRDKQKNLNAMMAEQERLLQTIETRVAATSHGMDQSMLSMVSVFDQLVRSLGVGERTGLAPQGAFVSTRISHSDFLVFYRGVLAAVFERFDVGFIKIDAQPRQDDLLIRLICTMRSNFGPVDIDTLRAGIEASALPRSSAFDTVRVLASEEAHTLTIECLHLNSTVSSAGRWMSDASLWSVGVLSENPEALDFVCSLIEQEGGVAIPYRMGAAAQGKAPHSNLICPDLLLLVGDVESANDASAWQHWMGSQFGRALPWVKLGGGAQWARVGEDDCLGLIDQMIDGPMVCRNLRGACLHLQNPKPVTLGSIFKVSHCRPRVWVCGPSQWTAHTVQTCLGANAGEVLYLPTLKELNEGMRNLGADLLVLDLELFSHAEQADVKCLSDLVYETGVPLVALGDPACPVADHMHGFSGVASHVDTAWMVSRLNVSAQAFTNMSRWLASGTLSPLLVQTESEVQRLTDLSKPVLHGLLHSISRDFDAILALYQGLKGKVGALVGSVLDLKLADFAMALQDVGFGRLSLFIQRFKEQAACLSPTQRDEALAIFSAAFELTCLRALKGGST
ncbi:hypothetical protein [Limnobacter sp.]|uniref:hypothetical protein n=1 Tax=Limnobacter sp. TaxID=2003368 RepID=UPI0035119AE5